MAGANLTQAYLDAVLAADRWQAQAATDAALADGLSPFAIYEQVFAPALYEVGLRWERAELSVTAEHIATALTESEMTRLLPRFLAGVRVGRTAVVASVEGEQHRVGARMVADCFESLGWDGVFVGGEVPLDDLLAEVGRIGPDMVALSLTVPMNLGALLKAVDALRARWPELPVLIGGEGLAGVEAPRLLRERPSVRYVADLSGLLRVLQSFGQDPDRASRAHAAAAQPPLPVAGLAPLIDEVRALPAVPMPVVDAYEAVADRLVADVDMYLAAQHDLSALVGPNGLKAMRQNHRNHALFIASWLRQPQPETLVRTLVWVLRAYRSHGFSLPYWDRELETWRMAIQTNLLANQAALLRPLYDWMQDAMPRLAELVDA